jgi:hypothetical protein
VAAFLDQVEFAERSHFILSSTQSGRSTPLRVTDPAQQE